MYLIAVLMIIGVVFVAFIHAVAVGQSVPDGVDPDAYAGEMAEERADRILFGGGREPMMLGGAIDRLGARKMIEKLSDEQLARIPEFVEKWTRIGLCTEPANRPEAEEGVRLAYRLAGLAPPGRIVWCGSPLSMGLTRSILSELDLLNYKIKSHKLELFSARERSSINASAWSAVEACLKGGVEESVRDGVKGHVIASVWSSIAACVHEDVWRSVHEGVRDGVRGSVLGSVLASVEMSVLESVLDGFGPDVLATVREVIRSGIQDGDGEGIASSFAAIVGHSIHGHHDSYWIGFCDYFKSVCGLSNETKKIFGLELVARNAGWWLPCEGICWISERHNSLRLNAEGRLHRDGGPAIAYPDGWAIHALNGVRVPGWIAVPPAGAIDPRRLVELKNVDVRREFVRKVGIERVCHALDARCVDRVGDYELLILDIGDGLLRPYLKMKNPSVPEIWHLEGVGVGCISVAEALDFRKPEALRRIPVAADGEDYYQQGDVCIWPRNAASVKPFPSILT